MSHDYRRSVVEYLLRKLYLRKEGSSKRPYAKPDRFYRDYYKNSCDLTKKELLDNVLVQLEEEGVISIKWDKGRYNIERFFLCSGSEAVLERLAENEFDIQTRKRAMSARAGLAMKYGNAGEEVDRSLRALDSRILKNPQSVNFQEEEDFLKAMSFLRNNTDDLYVREASAIIYGSTKVLEGYEAKILRAMGADSLEEFHVYRPDAEFQIKGDVVLDFGDHELNAAWFMQGISFHKEDVSKILRIKVNEPYLMTIENKTSFYRYSPAGTATVFLSGFANAAQIQVLRRIILDNPGLSLQHFGDIDAGGLRILDHLSRALDVYVEPYCMGVRELSDPHYKECLKPLEAIDHRNLRGLRAKHVELVDYMLKHNVKLEQEIIALALSRADGGRSRP